MIERDRNTKPVLFGKSHSFADDISVVQDTVMGEYDTFREPGRTAGILDIDSVIEGEQISPVNQFIVGYFFTFFSSSFQVNMPW